MESDELASYAVAAVPDIVVYVGFKDTYRQGRKRMSRHIRSATYHTKDEEENDVTKRENEQTEEQEGDTVEVQHADAVRPTSQPGSEIEHTTRNVTPGGGDIENEVNTTGITETTEIGNMQSVNGPEPMPFDPNDTNNEAFTPTENITHTQRTNDENTIVQVAQVNDDFDGLAID